VISTFFGCGYFPWFPGTIGSLAGLVLYLLLPESIYLSSNVIYFAGAVLVLSLLSIPVISKAEKYLGHDNGKIVLDEFLGFFLATILLPRELVTGIIVFVFFRIFDIWKPEPVNALQKLPGGWGVMADDLMAGIYANILARIVIKFII
jgi:phosphatidylglycerophosphatase A